MDILDIIKSRKSIRKYSERNIQDLELQRIIDAGLWGPSLFWKGVQPWKFVVIKEKVAIKRIADIMSDMTKKISVVGRVVLTPSARIVSDANVLIAIYDTEELSKNAEKFDEAYLKISRMAEISSIAASIQNMVLTAESLGIGSCWLDAPLLCESDVNDFLGEQKKLVAFLSLGYPAEKGNRSKRKEASESVVNFCNYVNTNSRSARG